MIPLKTINDHIQLENNLHFLYFIKMYSRLNGQQYGKVKTFRR